MSTFPDEDKKSFADRLKEVMGNESAHSFAKRAGVSYTAFRGYLDGGEPGFFKAIALAEAGNVSLEWLATGQEPRKTATLTDERAPDGVHFSPALVAKSAAAFKGYLDKNGMDMDPESFGDAVSLLCVMGAGHENIDVALIERLVKFKGNI